jgi:transmembrane sensor
MTDDLLVKFILEETTVEESNTVAHWIIASEANKKYFDELALIWDKSKALAATSTVNEAEAWQRFTQRINKAQTPVVTLSAVKKWLRIAAIFITVLGGGMLAYQYFKPVTQYKLLAVTTLKESKTDTLPDASVVTLNRNSAISYPSAFTGAERKVTLSGEAFFTITPNAKKPFIITVNDVTVKVVGTSFNIKSKNGKTEVIVETGIVQVTHHNKTVELKPKEKTVIATTDSVVTKEAATDKLYNYYRSKEFECDGTPLWKVVEVLNDAYDADIVIEDKEVAAMRLTTTFVNEPLDNILQIITQTFNLKVVKREKQILLKNTLNLKVVQHEDETILKKK